MLETIFAVITEVTGQERLKPQTELVRGLQLNSFAVPNIIAAVKAEFGITIGSRDVCRIQKISGTAADLESRGIHD